MKRFLKRSAFTIVEMVIVIAVIGILATVMIPTISGMIEKATVSADTQFVASLNIQLAIYDGNIEDPEDLQAAVDSYYGDGYFVNEMTSKSSKYGYYYWYDFNNRTMVLKKTPTAITDSDAGAGSEDLRANIGIDNAPVTMGGVGGFARTGATEFAPYSLRSGLVQGYYFADCGGELGELISRFETLGKNDDGSATDPTIDYETTIKDMYLLHSELKTDDPMKSVVSALVEKVKVTTIITEAGAFRNAYEAEIQYVYVPVSVSAIEITNVYLYDHSSMNKETVDKDTEFPMADNKLVAEAPIAGDTITQIVVPSNTEIKNLPAIIPTSNTGRVDAEGNVNSNWIASGATEILIKANSAKELAEKLQSNGKNIYENATNCVFVLSDGSRYIIDGKQLFRLPLEKDDKGEYIYELNNLKDNISVPADLTLSCPAGLGVNPGSGKIYFDGTNLYVSYDIGSFDLKAVTNSFRGVIWEANGDLLKVENGKVTVLRTPEKKDSSNPTTITATLVGTDTSDSMMVYVVRPTDVIFNLDGTEYEGVDHNKTEDPNAIQLNFTGNNNYLFELKDFVATYLYSNKVQSENVVFTSEDNDYFDIYTDSETGKTYLRLTEGLEDYSFTKTLTAKVGTVLTVEFNINVTDNSASAFEKNWIVPNKVQIGADYLFRVGNANAFEIGKLFCNTGVGAANNVCLEIFDVTAGNGSFMIGSDNNFTATVSKGSKIDGVDGWLLSKDNWANTTIKFTGTGIVKIRLGNKIGNRYDGFAELYVEVVNGTNVTTYSELKNQNSVLLDNITISNGGSYYLSNATLYGNGYTFYITGGSNANNQYSVVYINSAALDNVKIIGDTYTTYTGSTGADHAYSSAAVMVRGDSEIVNSYIYGCRAPVRLEGNLTLKESILAGGRYANIDIRSGNLILDSAITVNSSALGIVVDASSPAVNIVGANGSAGTLKQYNWMTSSDKSKVPNSYQAVFNELFDSLASDYQHTYKQNDKSTTYVNTGILLLNEHANTVNLSGYTGYTVSYAGNSRKLWTIADDTYELKAEDLQYRNSDGEYPFDPDQGATKPDYKWTYPSEYKDGKITLTVDEGASIKLNPLILKASKYGIPLNVSVSMNGTVYNGEITFQGTDSATYELVYTITDDVIYDIAGNRVTGVSFTYTKTVTVQLNVKKKVGPPTFTFYYGTKGSASAGSPHVTQPTGTVTGSVKEINGTKYITAGTSATADKIGSTTVNGQTIYYPIVDGINVRSGSAADYDFQRYYPIFKGVTIKEDTGTTYSYATTTDMPGTLEWVSVTFDGGNSVSGVKDGFVKYNDTYLCRTQTKGGDTEKGGTTVVTFRYTAENGEKYTYYVGYKFYDEDEGGVCVSGDTLITLADGTQVRVDSLTGDELLRVWDHTTGKITYAPIAYIVNHDESISEHNVLKLLFSDGTYLDVIGEHIFYDKTLNKYVAIDSENVDAYIGHTFVSNEGDGLKEVTLTATEIVVRNTGVYEVVTYKAITAFTNGILSASAYLDPLLNVFDMDADTLVYDEAKMLEDIATYGLYTFEDFEGLVPEEAFEMYNAAYLKIAVGKGYITWDDILNLIDIYYNNDVTPLQ